jgi:uroporphyrinogen III methyltransferase/synthase
VIVIGDVVRLRATLAWYEQRPLFGKRVLVTRAQDQAGEMLLALAAAGAETVHIPLIRLVAPEDPAELDAALDRLDGYDALLFTSANAVRFFVEHAAARGRDPAGFVAQVVCVGPRTAAAAARKGLPVHRVPKHRFDAEGMLAEIEKHLGSAGRRFLLPRAEGARELLPERLRAAGGHVDVVTVYRNVPAEVDASALRARLVAGDFDALTFTSPSTARNFAALLDASARTAAKRCLVAAIGPVTAEALRHEGLAPDVCPARADAAGLVEALAEAVSGAGAGGSA